MIQAVLDRIPKNPAKQDLRMPGKKLKFPSPCDYPAATPVVLCPADRAIGLYNQTTGKSAKKIAAKLKSWFEGEAIRKGWVACKFIPEVQSKHGAGAILLNAPKVTVNLNTITIE